MKRKGKLNSETFAKEKGKLSFFFCLQKKNDTSRLETFYYELFINL